jgi:enoyl-CoA hydratase
MSDLVRYDIKDRVAVITIDNPPVNALSPAVWTEIDDAVARAVADPAADAIVLIGAGSTFIAGADIKVFDVLKTREDSFARSAGTHALLRRMEDATKPLVAAIHGNALGGGLEVAQACHFRVATKDAKVGQPEVLLGIIPGAGGTQNLPRAIGERRAKEIIMTARPFSAEEASAWGLVNLLCEAAHLLPAALETASTIAANAPLAVRQAKKSIRFGGQMEIRTAYRFEVEAYNQLVDTDDRREGILAFNEKRKPQFKGK